MSDIKYYKLKICEIKSGIQMLDRLTTGNLSHHKNYLRNLLELYLKETEDLANEEQNQALNKHIVSNWQMYAGLGCIMMGIVGIAIAFVFACC